MAVIYEWREIRCIRCRLMGVGHVPYSGHGDRADEGACGVGGVWVTANTATLAVFGVLTCSGLFARPETRGAPEPQDVQETSTETQVAPSVVCPNCGEVVGL